MISYKGSIRQLATELCVEMRSDPLKEWGQEPQSGNSDKERIRSCFVIGEGFPSTLRSSPLGPTSQQRKEFRRLAESWRRDVMFVSDNIERVMHPAYQRIIGMGAAIVPLLLREVAETHEHWFWALESITGHDPVRPEDSGDVSKISEAWTEWGRRQRYLP